jgi:hypothetical protein
MPMNNDPHDHGPVEVFISYAHEDAEFLTALENHLASLRREGIMRTWYDRKIPDGEKWNHQLDEHLESAEIILLLVSAYFISSEYCYTVECKRAMERHEANDACVIPIILSPVMWEHLPIGKLKALPKDGIPVSLWKPDSHVAYHNVAEGIRDAVLRIGQRAHRVAPELSTSQTGKILVEAIMFVYGRQRPETFDEREFLESLRRMIGVNNEKVRIVAITNGSLRVHLEGDGEELTRIVEGFLRSSELRRRFSSAGLQCITYKQEGLEYSLNLPSQRIPIVLVICALVVAGIGELLAIDAGFAIDYRIAVVGTIIISALTIGFVSPSSLRPLTRASKKSIPLARAWTFALLICAITFFIFAGVFFSWPRPLEAYLPNPTPSPVPTPFATPLVTPTLIATASPSVTAHHFQIRMTEVPPYDEIGGPNSNAHIAGEVSGVDPKDYEKYGVLIYSLTRTTWWVQPETTKALNKIKDGGKWDADIHTGKKYAALLVPKDYPPLYTTDTQPSDMTGVLAIIQKDGKNKPLPK